MKKEAIAAVNRYNKENTKCIQIRLNFKTDADILDKLERVPSKMGYIKSLIRQDLENEIKTAQKT